MDASSQMSSAGWMPHGHCFLWTPDVLFTWVTSDAVIAASYYSIPLALLYFVRQRNDLAFRHIFLLFGAFILLCGTTHVMAIVTLWNPVYRLEGVVKAATAIVSIFTAIVLFKSVPLALKIPSPAQLEAEVRERRQAEVALAQAHAALEASHQDLEQRVLDRTAALLSVNRDLETLLHVISHDLKEPVRSMVGFSQLLQEEASETPEAPVNPDYPGRIVHAGQRLQRQLADIQTLASVRSSPRAGPPLALETVIDDILDELRPIAEAGAAQITVNGPLPSLVVDGRWAREALYNLITNALKYPSPGQPAEVVIEATGGSRGQGVVVRDRGPGVPAAQRELIFQLFKRGEAGHDKEGEGAGLAIVRAVAERYGGQAWVEGRQGGGSSFHVTFSPPAQAPEEDPGPSARAEG